MNRIVNARKESHDSDKFIRKTNDDVNEWMDEFYVDGRDASFNLHCLWAWQEQERRHGSLIAEIEPLKKDAARYRWTTIEGNWVARMFGKWRAHIGEYGDSNPTDWFDTREEAIDAAMSNKE